MDTNNETAEVPAHRYYIFEYHQLTPVGQQPGGSHAVINGQMGGSYPNGMVLSEIKLARWKKVIRENEDVNSYFALNDDESVTFEGHFPNQELAEATIYRNDPNDKVVWVITPELARQILATE